MTSAPTDFDPMDPPEDVTPAPTQAPAPVWDDPGFACSTEAHWVTYFPVRFANGTGDLPWMTRLVYRALLDLLFCRGGFIQDNLTAVASDLGITWQQWRPCRAHLLRSGKLIRLHVAGRGGVWHLGSTLAHRVLADAADRSHHARDKAAKRWNNKDRSNAGAHAAANAAAHARAHANEHEHKQSKSEGRFKPHAVASDNPYLIDLDPAQSTPAQLPLADFARVLVRRLNTDPDRNPFPDLNGILSLLSTLRANGSRCPAQDLLNHASRHGDRLTAAGEHAHNPMAYLRRHVMPEALAALADGRPSTETPADTKRADLFAAIQAVLLAKTANSSQKPRTNWKNIWQAMLPGPLPGENGCAATTADIQEALAAKGFDWRGGLAIPRGSQPRHAGNGAGDPRKP